MAAGALALALAFAGSRVRPRCPPPPAPPLHRPPPPDPPAFRRRPAPPAGPLLGVALPWPPRVRARANETGSAFTTWSPSYSGALARADIHRPSLSPAAPGAILSSLARIRQVAEAVKSGATWRDSAELGTVHFAGSSSDYSNTDAAAEFVEGAGHALVAETEASRIQTNGMSFSVEAWVNHEVRSGSSAANTTDLPCYIASQGEESSSDDEGWRIGFSADMHFVFGFGSGDDLRTRETWEQDRGQWRHWAVTYDKETKERVIYRDGVPLAKDTSASGDHNSTGSVVLGFRYVYTDDSGSHYSEAGRHFSGLLDEVRVFSTALTARNVQEFMHMSSVHVIVEHPQKTSIMAYYDFNSDGSAWLSDQSGGGKNLTGLAHEESTLAPTQQGGVGQKAIFTSPGKGNRQAGIFKICPARQKVARALDAPANLITDYADVQEDLQGKSCDTDLGHRHAIVCDVITKYHTAHVQRPDRGMPREYYCDGDYWMPMPFSFTDLTWSGRTAMHVQSEIGSNSSSAETDEGLEDARRRRATLAEEGSDLEDLIEDTMQEDYEADLH